VLHIIHVFWEPTPGFYNDGTLNLWIESPGTKGTSKQYPYQLDDHDLMSFGNIWLSNHIEHHEKKEVALPCDAQGQPIPSPVISNLSGLSDLEMVQFNPWVLNCLRIKAPLSFLKELNFQRHYFEENIQLGYDAQFWILASFELSNLMKQDNYIPSFIAKKDKGRTEYYAKWQILSQEYQKKMVALADKMPFAACLNATGVNQPLSVLNHFSEVVLNQLLRTTVFTKQIEKLTSETCLESHLQNNTKPIILSDDVWKDWKSWKNNLDYDQFGAPFYVCFRLNSPTEQDTVDSVTNPLINGAGL